MKYKHIILDLLCLFTLLGMSGCSPSNQKTKSKKSNATSSQVSMKKKTGTFQSKLFVGKEVTMELIRFYYDHDSEEFIIKARIQNRSKKNITVDYDTCVINGYQIPLYVNESDVDAGNKSIAELTIMVDDLNKAGITLDQAIISFLVEDQEDDDILEKDTTTIPANKFVEYQRASSAYKPVKKMNKVFLNKKGVKASIDRCYYDASAESYNINVTIQNHSTKDIELSSDEGKVDGYQLDVTDSDNEVRKGNSIVAEYFFDEDDLKEAAVNIKKSGGTVKLILEDENNDNEEILSTTMKIPGSYFKS